MPVFADICITLGSFVLLDRKSDLLRTLSVGAPALRGFLDLGLSVKAVSYTHLTLPTNSRV